MFYQKSTWLSVRREVATRSLDFTGHYNQNIFFDPFFSLKIYCDHQIGEAVHYSWHLKYYNNSK